MALRVFEILTVIYAAVQHRYSDAGSVKTRRSTRVKGGHPPVIGPSTEGRGSGRDWAVGLHGFDVRITVKSGRLGASYPVERGSHEVEIRLLLSTSSFQQPIGTLGHSISPFDDDVYRLVARQFFEVR